MKKFIKSLCFIIAPLMLVSAFFAGCKSCKGKKVSIETGNIMQDIDVEPAFSPDYEQYSKQAYEEYKAVAAKHLDGSGEPDPFNPEVIAAAIPAAAKLYAYACYNERTLDQYVFLSDMEGKTDLGSNGSATARRQEYYLRVNESDKTCGYRFHYTIRKVVKSDGFIDTMKSLFESARIRFTDETDLLYRFEGSGIKFGAHHDGMEIDLLRCNWRTGDDWGKPDVAMRKFDFIQPEDVAADIIAQAGQGDPTMRGNINILAENILQFASITEDEECINVMMTVNTEIANKDEASVKMLTRANDTSGSCHWRAGESDEDAEGIAVDTGLRIICRLWKNGLFRNNTIIERWRGKTHGFNGTADPVITYWYSYSDRDCDMTQNLAMLEAAKLKVD